MKKVIALIVAMSTISSCFSVSAFAEEAEEIAVENIEEIAMENAEEIAHKIISRGLTVRQTEELVNNLKNHKIEQICRAVKKDANLKELEKDLTKNIGLKVKINAKEDNQGKVTIEYKNPAELNTILELLEKNK